MTANFQGSICVPILCFAIDDDVEVIGRLQDTWKSQVSENLSADITYLSFFRARERRLPRTNLGRSSKPTTVGKGSSLTRTPGL